MIPFYEWLWVDSLWVAFNYSNDILDIEIMNHNESIQTITIGSEGI